MSQPYYGEIRMFGGNFAPLGWAMCNGQLMSIVENDALFTLIGTTYGGDGQTTFGLPDLRGRIPIHAGQGPGLSNRVRGESSGVETVTLTVNQLSAHGHALASSTDTATQASPAGNLLAQPSTIDLYRPATVPSAALSPNAITSAGGSQPHDTMGPFLSITFIIALEGLFPTQG